MKRRPPIVLILLLLVALVGGAIVNVAVAWLAPLRWQDYESDGGNLQKGDRDWKWLENRNWPLAGNHTWHYWRQGLGWRSDQFALKRPIDVAPMLSAPLVASRDRSGWPLYALGYYSESGSGDFVGFDERYGGMVIEGTMIGRRRDHGIFVYTSPLWHGFAINTVFYALILWLVFAAPFALRRRRRIKRGLCPKCAYPRGAGTNQVCTECGAAVPR